MAETQTVRDRNGEDFTIATHPDGLMVTLVDCGMNYMTVLTPADACRLRDFLTRVLDARGD